MRAFAQKPASFRNAPAMAAPREPVPRQQREKLNAPACDLRQIPVFAAPLKIQPKLEINQPGDAYEQQADRISEQVMRMPEPHSPEPHSQEPHSQDGCSCGGSCSKCRSDSEALVQARHIDASHSGHIAAPPSVHHTLRVPGRPLDQSTRSFMESRFHHDFGSVRVHSDERASDSAREIHALAYTVGSDIVFGARQYAPGTPTGRKLLAHELTHVVQQTASPSLAAVAQRQIGANPAIQQGAIDDAVAEREYGGGGAPKAHACGGPSWCPPGFCQPYSSQKLAEYYRAQKSGWLLAGISAFVDSRVVPFWRDYLWGGSAPKNITGDFAKDFTNSPTTLKTTNFLIDELKKSLTAKPPAASSVNLSALIPSAIAEIDDPASRNRMNFNIPKDIPGNLAGDIGKDETACPAGAKPSPFNDERQAHGTVALARSASGINVTPQISYTVKDTVDLCPGDCGSTLEQIATVPLSQFEATGISGDVPFTVDFPAPAVGSFTIPAPSSASPVTPPPPAPAPKVPAPALKAPAK